MSKKSVVRKIGKVILLLAAAGIVLGLGVVALAWTAFGSKPSGESVKRISASPQFSDGAFANELEENMGPIPEMLKRAMEAVHTVPEKKPPVVPTVAKDFAGSKPGQVYFTWFGHSTVLLEMGERLVLIDPVFSERASPWQFFGPARFHEPPMTIEDLPKLDAVLISHDHYDHLDHHSIKALIPKVERFLVPLGIKAHLEYWGVPAKKIVELDWWESERLGEIEFVSVPSRHFSGRSAWDRNRTLWTGWVVHTAESRVFYSGDTAMFPGFKEIGEKYGPFDLTIIESGAYDPTWADVHLGPEQAVQAHVDAKGKVMFGVHWGTFDLANHSWTEPVERLKAAAKKKNVNLVYPRVGERVTVKDAPTEKWWPDVPFETAEDSPVISSGL